ncbi:hypothetical protein C8F01DRAFT_1367116 [Mycena amicta]|nr:hypothetical protein C8F01DRAFT_1367116 [Mycena amicta]
MATSPRQKQRDHSDEEPEDADDRKQEEHSQEADEKQATEETVSPTDNVLKIKSRETRPSQPAPQLYSPPYHHHQQQQQQWHYRAPDQPWLPAPDAEGGGPPRQQPQYLYPEHEMAHHHSVRLPSIATLLTEPFNPPPRGPVYSDRQDWQAQPQQQPMPIALPPAQDRYPPVVAPLPLDDSRARSPHPMPQRKRGRLPKETTDFLKAWLHSHSAHPYPSEIEKKQMCHATGLSMSQVSNWMINGRRRILGPSYLSTSRSNPQTSPPVTLSTPSVHSAPVLLTAPTMMLRSPTNPNPGS